MTSSRPLALAVSSGHLGENHWQQPGLARARSTNDLHPPKPASDQVQAGLSRIRRLSLHHAQVQVPAQAQVQAQAQAQAQQAQAQAQASPVALGHAQPHDAPPPQVLTFTDVPSDIARLRLPLTPPPSTAAASGSLPNNAPTLPASRDTPAFDPPPVVDPKRHVDRTTPISHDKQKLPEQPHPSSSPQLPPLVDPASSTPPSAIRKTSPGLAARLKALGFGSSNKKTTPAQQAQHSDRVGRLNEDQLRQLDEKHHAGSLGSIISRRGRPWKGAAAAPRKQSTHEPPTSSVQVSGSSPFSDNPVLPEIVTTGPIVMDTQKYRLPDHTNGNGTKSTPETRREHLERDHLASESEDTTTVVPPPPPPKETPPATETPPAPDGSQDFPGLGAYFEPGHNRPGSIYTLSRASFANQLAQLTSLQLPDAESLSSKVSAIPTAQVASKALINAAEQIRSWIAKATEVIGGLDSEDDVEWAAAGGREGLAEVENAINRFEDLIHVYVSAIEELQGRTDIANVPADDLKRAVSQMESILTEWAKIRQTLNSVRAQVEIAMEWEELWNNVLGDIQGEVDELSRLVFEMEERRHKGAAAAATGESVDIGDLETIVEDTPPQASRLQTRNRFSLPAFPMTPTSPGTPSLSADDSSLLALFARMQPLKASLEFLPMRLSVFEARAEKSFPTACEELEMRRNGLDGSYKKLEKDAESLRKELGEDRWVIVFRGAGRQALKMHESVERSLLKAKEAVDAGLHLTNQPTMMKKIESYEAKRTHYGPAIERVLAIIDKGVKDRLTVNGEVLRLHADMEQKWTSLKEQMRETDAILEDVLASSKSQQLRDSISSMLSNEPSTTGSGHETPGSSPPSSIIMSSLGLDPHTPVPKNSKTRSSSVNSSATSRRHSSLPAPATQLGRKMLSSRLSTIPGSSANTPNTTSKLQRPNSTLAHRPRWNSSTTNPDTGHNFKPSSLTTPSPYSRRTPTTQRSTSSLTPSPSANKIPSLQSRLTRAASESPRLPSASKNLSPGDTTPSKRSTSRLASFRERLASPGPYSQQTLGKPRLTSQSSTSSTMPNRRASMQPVRPALSVENTQVSRPASSLASTSRRSSLLPQPKASSVSGRESPLRLSRLGMRKNSSTESTEARPKWRP